jgi:hypothetical protein
LAWGAIPIVKNTTFRVSFSRFLFAARQIQLIYEISGLARTPKWEKAGAPIGARRLRRFTARKVLDNRVPPTKEIRRDDAPDY